MNKSVKKHQDFLQTFMPGDFGQEKEVNGFWLVKHWDGHDNFWRVDVFTRESYRSYKNYFEEKERQKNFFSQI